MGSVEYSGRNDCCERGMRQRARARLKAGTDGGAPVRGSISRGGLSLGKSSVSRVLPTECPVNEGQI